MSITGCCSYVGADCVLRATYHHLLYQPLDSFLSGNPLPATCIPSQANPRWFRKTLAKGCASFLVRALVAEINSIVLRAVEQSTSSPESKKISNNHRSVWNKIARQKKSFLVYHMYIYIMNNQYFAWQESVILAVELLRGGSALLVALQNDG